MATRSFIRTATMVLCGASICLFGCDRSVTETGTHEPPHEAHDAQQARLAPEPLQLDLAEGQVAAAARGFAHLDPQSGAICWPAVMCTLEDCPGRGPNGEPRIYPFAIDGATVNANGNVVWTEDALSRRDARCPACGRDEGFAHYVPAVVEQRHADLVRELGEARAALKAARRQGLAFPSQLRTPQEILDDLAQLPRIFLQDRRTGSVAEQSRG